LAMLEHAEGNLAVSERHFDNVMKRTSHWRGPNGSLARSQVFDEYGSMLRTAGRAEEAEVAESRVLGLTTTMPDLQEFKDPLMLSDYEPSDA
ncbi:tetratricopeptide repeat protein, partial [Acinetobacter baumannii]